MKTHSAKAKGRRLQQWVRDQILKYTDGILTEYDVRSTSMGAGGMDVKLSAKARKVFPFSVECKNTERLNVWKAYEQATFNSRGLTPLAVIKKNHTQPLVVVDAKTFFKILFEGKDNDE